MPLELPPASPEDPPPEVLTLALGQSRRLHLEHEATAVSVASPEIADVQLLSPTVLYVIGKGIGRTSIAVLVGDDWNEERIVAVDLDLEPLRAALGELSDLTAVRVKPLARGVVLAGEVASPEVADRALRTATTILPEGVPIENELRIAGPQQVNLEVQIAEVSRSVTEELGGELGGVPDPRPGPGRLPHRPPCDAGDRSPDRSRQPGSRIRSRSFRSRRPLPGSS